MTSIERFTMAGLMALSAGLGATGAVYLRPVQPASPQAAIIPAIPETPPIRTVTWFKAHPPEIKVKLNACDDNPGVAVHDPECFNAGEAAAKLSLDRQLEAARAHGMLR